MKRRLRDLMNSSSIFPMARKPLFLQASKQQMFRHQQGGKTEVRRETNTARSAAVLIRNKLRVPKLTLAQIELLNSQAQPQFVTRHIRKDLLQIHLEGSYRFGTIASYKGTEDRQLGRFGDTSEGRQRTTYSSRSGHLANFRARDVQIQDGFFDHENQVVFEDIANDFCSCVSVGTFGRDRALAIREAEAGNASTVPEAYVTYDLGKLLEALTDIMREHRDLSEHQLLRRQVVYGHKDVRWEVGRDFEASQLEPLEIWLDAAFIKPSAFAHEDELRILIIDPSSPGGLDESSGPISFKDSRIAAAITDYGTF